MEFYFTIRIVSLLNFLIFIAHWFFTEPLIIGEDDDHEVKSLHSSDEEDDKSADDNHEQFAR